MQTREKFRSWLNYLIDYLHNTFFTIILLFIVSFFAFGLYQGDYLTTNLIIALIFLVIILYFVKRLLYKRARPTKILVILIVLCLAFFTAKSFSNDIFEKIGVKNFLQGSLNSTNSDLNFSDGLILAGVSDVIKEVPKAGSDIIKTTIMPGSKEKSIEVFAYINQLRKENSVGQIGWDDNIYGLAKYKLEDMQKRNYFDHVDPDGKCVGSYASNFGLNYPSSSFADNLFGYSSPTIFDQKEAVDSWLNSRGHKYNLLYSGHSKGAFACDMQNCIFIGFGGSGWVCATGAEGIAFWQTAGKQQGE